MGLFEESRKDFEKVGLCEERLQEHDELAKKCERSKVTWKFLHGRVIAELLSEVRRLKAGRLTPEEFNELCHNLHEQGRPITRLEHFDACEKFRDSLFGPEEKLVGPNRCQSCGGEYGEHSQNCYHKYQGNYKGQKHG